jgi:hypothetical protein
MPYKFDTNKLRIGSDNDRRIKIPKSEHAAIFELHKLGIAIRAIGRKYGVDHRTIQFILFPERLEICRQHLQNRGGSKQYYDKDKWKLIMREHRAYRLKLFNEGKLK